MKSSSAPLILSLSVIMAAGCGGRESAASKSAAEFDREQQKGGAAPATGGAHGGHAAGQEPVAKDADPMAGMDHSQHAPATGAATPRDPMAGMDHSQHAPAARPATGAATPRDPMAGMDHSNMPGMDHSKMTGMTMAPPVPDKQSILAEPGQPAETLRPGSLDGPAPTSVRDADRSAALARGMSGGGHAMSHGTYSQTDAGRADAPPAAHGDTGAAGAPGASTPDPHAGHRMPAPSPKPSPAPKENR